MRRSDWCERSWRSDHVLTYMTDARGDRLWSGNMWTYWSKHGDSRGRATRGHTWPMHGGHQLWSSHSRTYMADARRTSALVKLLEDILTDARRPSAVVDSYWPTQGDHQLWSSHSRTYWSRCTEAISCGQATRGHTDRWTEAISCLSSLSRTYYRCTDSITCGQATRGRTDRCAEAISCGRSILTDARRPSAVVKPLEDILTAMHGGHQLWPGDMLMYGTVHRNNRQTHHPSSAVRVMVGPSIFVSPPSSLMLPRRSFLADVHSGLNDIECTYIMHLLIISNFLLIVYSTFSYNHCLFYTDCYSAAAGRTSSLPVCM